MYNWEGTRWRETCFSPFLYRYIFFTVKICYFIVNTNLLQLANYLLNWSFTENILENKHDKASSL